MNDMLDLHGCSVPEALELFASHYNARLERGDRSPFHVVHGWGSTGEGGTIRTAVLRMLESNREYLLHEADPFNPGRTLVKPRLRLPSGAGIIAGEILAFCEGGKTESKVLGRFRRHGDMNVKQTLRKLVKEGRLTRRTRGRHTVYSPSGT